MSNLRMKWGVAFLIVLVVIAVLFFHAAHAVFETESTIGFVNDSKELVSMLDLWNKKGRQENVDMSLYTPYVTGYAFSTNFIYISNHLCRIPFVADDAQHSLGKLAITEDGIILWINKRDGSIIISPEKNHYYGVLYPPKNSTDSLSTNHLEVQ